MRITIIVIFLLSLLSCADDYREIYVMDSVSNMTNLPECETNMERKLHYVKAENKLYFCSAGEWEQINTVGEPGEDGKDGKDGENGKNGKDGRMVKMVKMVKMEKMEKTERTVKMEKMEKMEKMLTQLH